MLNLLIMVFLEEYTLLDELGQGGFATVYKVRHNELGYIRALRVLNAVIARGTEDKAYKRFVEECRLLMRIGNGNHPNIVHINRTLLKEQRAAVEMDYVDGLNLSDHVARCRGFVPAGDVMVLIEQMSSALAYCHEDIYRFCMDKTEDGLQDDPENGAMVLLDDHTKERLIQKYRVIHNDIHSDNIIRRNDGAYVLLDFGLAIHGENVVRSSRRMDGAPEFKAPEKWDGISDMTTQSDIYSLGVVLYEALAGRVPFPLLPEEAGSARAIYLLGEAHKHKVPDSIFELRKAAYEKLHPGESYDVPDYPLWLEDAIMKCLEKDPEKRFRNGKELYEFVIARKNEQERLVAETLVELERLKKDSAETKEPADEEAQDTEQKDEDIVVEIEDRKKPLNRWAVVALAMALIAFGSVIFCIFGHRISGIQKPSAPLAQDHPALLYLDDQNVLVRSEVEAYPELSGLWDALNTYDYAAYSSYYGLLQNSEKYFYNLMMMRSMREKMDEMHGAGYTYASEGKDEINLSSYLFKLMSTGRKKR